MIILRLSKFGLLIVLSFAFLSLAARFLYPFADEPDWTVRAPSVLFGDHPFWSPYYIFRNWLNTLSIDNSVCAVQASPMSLWAHIPNQCSENFEQIIIRWVLTLFILMPMLLIIVLRQAFIRFMSVLHVRLSYNEWNNRIDALALSLLFPGMLFYLGVLSLEQLHLIAALYIFLFWGFWFLIFSLLVIMLSIDLGNSVVAIFFIGALWFFTHFSNNGRKKLFLFISLLLCLAYFVNFKILDALLNISFVTVGITQKSLAMLSALDGSELLTKYPIFLRPIISFMSFVFLTPTGVKAPLLYVLFSLYFVGITLKVIEKRNNNVDVIWFIPIAVIVFFVISFPTYSNAKYYIFMLPFLIYVSLLFFNKRNIFLFFLAANTFVFLHLILYRL